MRHQAIRNLYANAVTIIGDEAFDKDKNKITIDKTAVDNEVKRLQDEYDNDYKRKRKEEYPSLEDCIHAILDDDLDNLQELRQAVKEKYPKWNLAIVILKNKSVIVGNEKYFIPCFFFYPSNI